MRYALVPTKEYAKRSWLRFAWYPRRLSWVWVWLEWYRATEQYLDPDGDGVFEWVLISEVTNG